MTDINLVKKYLSQEIWDYANSFQIPDEFLIDYPQLIEMVLRSKSIDTNDEKQNWFNLLPIMNDEQIDKLKWILVREKEKLDEIENKYEQKKVEIKKKYLMKWQKMWYFKKVSEIHENEEKAKSQEEEEAEKLLEMI